MRWLQWPSKRKCLDMAAKLVVFFVQIQPRGRFAVPCLDAKFHISLKKWFNWLKLLGDDMLMVDDLKSLLCRVAWQKRRDGWDGQDETVSIVREIFLLSRTNHFWRFRLSINKAGNPHKNQKMVWKDLNRPSRHVHTMHMASHRDKCGGLPRYIIYVTWSFTTPNGPGVVG